MEKFDEIGNKNNWIFKGKLEFILYQAGVLSQFEQFDKISAFT